jgi:two-component system, NtrC family, sensor kinase
MARILVLDDDPAISRLYALWLGSAHEITVMNTASDALARIQAGERFDTVVCDVHMPAMSGFELHAAIQRVEPEQARRVVFVTAGLLPEERAILPTIRNHLLIKPFGIDELREVVNGFLPIRLSR